MSRSETPGDWAAHMQDARRATQPSPDAVARVQQRLGAALTPTTSLLQELPSPPPGAAARVQARLATAPRGAAPLRLAPAAAVVLATLGAGTWWLATAEPALALSDQALTVDGVERLRFDGEGTTEPAGGRVAVDWVVGRLEILPGSAMPVDVTTRETEAMVETGGLVLVRDALGSHLEAIEVALDVRCGEGPIETLAAGERVTCLPTTPAGLLGRARALVDDGDPGAALDAVRHGIERAPRGPVGVELHTVGMDAALVQGDTALAVAFAEDALGLGASTRSDDLHRVAARGWLLEGDCERALPHLDALEALDEAEERHRERCLDAGEAR